MQPTPTRDPKILAILKFTHRLQDRSKRPIVSLAVLDDERARWRPSRYRSALWGCSLTVPSPLVTLRTGRRPPPLRPGRPGPPHRAGDPPQPQERADAKFALIRRLYERGASRDAILNLFRFIDWIMQLPDDIASQFWLELRQYEEAHKVPYITSVERIGRQEGLQEGMQKGRQEGLQEGKQEGLREGLLAGIALGLELKFGPAGLALLPEIERLEDVATIPARSMRVCGQ